MDVANTFIPTAGTTGLLAMITYFFLQAATYVFLGSFIFSLVSRNDISSNFRSYFLLTTLASAIAGLAYYQMQTYYVTSLADLATVTDQNDRDTLFREAYNAVGQYRYVVWFVVSPLIVGQLVSLLNVSWSRSKRQLAGLLMATTLMALASYIGHQQLSFDNEIQTVPKLLWGLIAAIDYVFVFFTLKKLGQEFQHGSSASSQQMFWLGMRLLLSVWGVYLLGYFLTLLPIDFNWIHLLFTLADLAGIVGPIALYYVVNKKEHDTIQRSGL